MSRRAVLSLGANLGDRRATLQSAVEALAAAEGVTVVAVSRLVESGPVGGPPQPDYLNAIVLVDTTLAPHTLLATCQRIELDHGRQRVIRWEARTLDIDLVTFQGVIAADDILELPHPRAAQRAFVLVPWLDIDPDAVLSDPDSVDGAAVSIRDLLAQAGDAAGVRPATVAALAVPK